MNKKIFSNKAWIIGIAIFVLMIIIPCHAIPKVHSGSRTPKTDGRSVKKELLLSQDFESLDDITAASGSYSGVSLVPGKSGNGVKIDASGAYITYPTAGHFNIQKGTLEFWVKPLFDMHVPPTNSAKQYLFDFQWGENQQFSIMMLKIPAAPNRHAFWGLDVFFPPTNDPPKADFASLEPYMFCKSMRPNIFSRFRAYWDFSLPNTDALSIYYSGSGTAYYSVNSTDGIVLSASGVVKRIGYRSGYYNLGAWVSAINAVKGFHATLIGNPTAQGFMVNTPKTALPATSKTAATFQQMKSYLILQANDVYSPVYWRNYLTPQKLLSGATMGFGCQANHNYPGHVILDSLKVWNTVELPVIHFPQHFANPYFPKTMATYNSLFANDGFCSAHETHATQPNDCPILDTSMAPGKDVVFFERPAFEWVLPNYVPDEREIKNKFTYKVPLGEYETVFFNIYSRIALTDMVLNYTALTGPGTIAKTNLDLRVVYNWFQGSYDQTSATRMPVYAPELMLHCDVFDGVRQIDPQRDPTIGQFKIPTLLKQDHVETKMAAYTSKQFGLTIHVPPDTPPGGYTGIVAVTAAQLKKPLIMTLNFTVLPFTLRDSGSIAMPWLGLDDIWYFASPSRMNLNFWDIYNQIMVEMTKYGIYGAQHGCVNDYDAGHGGDIRQGNAYKIAGMTPLNFWKKKLELAKKAGMKMACIYAGFRPTTRNLEYTPELVKAMKSYGFAPWLFGQDEFTVPGTVDNQVGISARVKDIGGLIFTNTSYGYAQRLNSGYTTTTLSPNITYTPDQTRLDGASYIIGDPHLHEMQAGRELKVAGRFETYYFQTRVLYPNHERYWCGYFRYLTGCNGPQPTWFMAFPSGWGDFGAGSSPSKFSNYGVAYHAIDQAGNYHIIPTLHGCAMREGFKDDKYLATWKYNRDRVIKTHPREVADSQTVVDAILERYKEAYGHVVIPAMRNSAKTFADDRETIIGEIIKLINLHSGKI